MITGCILARDEASRIEACIRSLKQLTHDIIVIDNDSTDNTRQLAEGLGCRVFSVTGDTMDLLRNEYICKADGEWIFVLDADEVITASAAREIRKEILSAENESHAYYRIPRFDYIGNGVWAENRLGSRLFRRGPGVKYNDFMYHASVIPSIVANGGTMGKLFAPIHHMDMLSRSNNKNKRDRYIKGLIADIRSHISEPDVWVQMVFLGMEFLLKGMYAEADMHFDKAKKINGAAMDYEYMAKAKLYILMEDYDLSAYYATGLIDKSARFADYGYSALAEISLQRNDTCSAMKYAREAVDKKYRIYSMLNLASLLVATAPEEAIGLCAKAIAANPYILEPSIYKPVSDRNIYSLQSFFLTSYIGAPLHLSQCYHRLGDRANSCKWQSVWKNICEAWRV